MKSTLLTFTYDPGGDRLMQHALIKLVLGLTIVVALALTGHGVLSGAGPLPTGEAHIRADHGSDTPTGPLHTHAIRGVNYAHIHRGDRGYGSQASRNSLAELQDIGVDWIALNPFGYQRTADQDRIAGYDPDRPLTDFTAPLGSVMPDSDGLGRDPSMTDVHLIQQIKDAHALGIKVIIKPHIWSSDFWNGDAWHGTIDQPTPQTQATWRKSYLRFILHHARLAEHTNAEALCLGTELVSQTTRHPDDWHTLIHEVRKVYQGKLTYAAHWDTEYEAIPFWNELDAIGISAYFPLNAPDDPTVDQLIKAWQPHKRELRGVQARFGKPVVFLEAGYRPAKGTHRAPWQDKGGDYDPSAQSRAFEAMYRTFADEPWWHGVFIWKEFTDTRRSDRHRGEPGFTFRNEPAEDVMRHWFHRP